MPLSNRERAILTAPPASGSQTIDSFNDGDISEYEEQSNGSLTASQTLTFEGSHALTSATSGSTPFIFSTSGLPTYPEPGDKFQYRACWNSGSDPRMEIKFGPGGGRTNCYFARLGINNDNIQIGKWSDGSGASIATGSLSGSFNQGEWYRGVIKWATDGTITFSLFDSAGNLLAETSATDSEHGGGGVGWEMGDSPEEVFVDLGEITGSV